MPPRRARIVHLITRLELGGAQQNTLYCVEHHDRARFSVSLWAGQGGMLDDVALAIPDADVRIVPWIVHPIAPLRDAGAVLRLAAGLREVDLLHTHSSKAGILGRAAARLAGVPGVVHTVHGWSFNDAQAPATRRAYLEAERAAARVTDRIVCVSHADRDRGLASGIGHPSQYRILRSGIDPRAYAAQRDGRERVRRAIGATPEDLVVGSLANLKPQKAPLDFVEAARIARSRDPRLRFFIAGDGPMRAEVEAAVARAGLQGAFTLLGWRDDVPDLLAGMDVFLLTSLFEGLPRAVLQAMAAAVPVVATHTGGVEDVIVDGVTGRLVPPGDPGAAAEAIVSLAADAALRMRFARSAASRLNEEFDIRRLVSDLEDLYDDVLARARPKTRDATPASHLGGAWARH